MNKVISKFNYKCPECGTKIRKFTKRCPTCRAEIQIKKKPKKTETTWAY